MILLLRSRNVYQGTKAKKYADVLTVLLKIFKRGVVQGYPIMSKKPDANSEENDLAGVSVRLA